MRLETQSLAQVYLLAALIAIGLPALIPVSAWAQGGVRYQMLLKEAKTGAADAQYALGLSYASGFGVEENPAEAVKWYRRAADQGMAIAQKNLAEFLAQGKGTTRNYVEAYKWYEIAIPNLTDSLARVLQRVERDNLAKKMKPSELAKAKELAAAWRTAFKIKQNGGSKLSNGSTVSKLSPKGKKRTESDPADQPVLKKPKKETARDEASFSRILLVGPKRKLKKPSQAARIARPGDLIKIDAGDYKDCAIWRTKNLTIRGVGGFAHVKDVSCDGKAIWVFYAAPVKIQSIRFSGSRVLYRNGAGIRWEGYGRLTLSDSWFHNNQMGILTHDKKQSELIVTNSRFEENGDCFEFCGHGIYAGRIRRLEVTNSQFYGHRHGHHIKSRAYYSGILGNRIIDGPKGTASFSINLPDSGTASIRYNYMEKGLRSENAMAMISIGEEGQKKDGHMNPSRGILIENNSFQNTRRRSTNFVWNRSWHAVSMRSNRFGGNGRRYHGYGREKTN